jgi:hypothetical protein
MTYYFRATLPDGRIALEVSNKNLAEVQRHRLAAAKHDDWTIWPIGTVNG